MTPVLDIVAVCLVLTALLACLNARFVRLPTTIVVVFALLLGVLASGQTPNAVEDL